MGNPDLQPQRVHTVEGQISLHPTEGVAVSTGVAYSRLLNRARFVQRGLNRVAENLAEVECWSWESEVVVRYDRWLEATASSEVPFVTRDLGQQGYQADLVGTANTIYPSYILRFDVFGEIPGLGLRPGIEALRVGPRRASEMNLLEQGGDYELPPYTMLDITLSTVGIELLDDRETVILVKGRNVLDVRGPDPGFAGVDYPLLPASVLAQLRQQF
jgi:iron complex outermembrane receptor protein